MTADDFVTIVRKGSDKLRVDDIVLNTGEQEFHGSGMLRIEGKRFALDMQLNDGEKLPDMQSGVYTRRDSWKLKGVIEYDLEFKCDTVGPIGNGDILGRSRTFRLHPISLSPSSWDAKSDTERAAFFEQLSNNSESSAGGKQAEQVSDVGDLPVRIEAMFFEYPFFEPFCGKEWKGEIEGFDFTIKKEKDGADLWVSLNSKKDYVSLGEKEDLNKLHGLMNALAFTNGANAWPYRTQYWRSGRKISDVVTAVDQLARISHGPFTDNLAFAAIVGRAHWDYPDLLKKAAAFFETNSALTHEVITICFLLREADDKEVHSDITIIALCALFENLVQLLFRELQLKERAMDANGDYKDPSLRAFLQAKRKTKAYISQQLWNLVRPLFKDESIAANEQIEGDGLKLLDRAKKEFGSQISGQIVAECEGWKRMYAVVQGGQDFSIREMFQAILNHFQFDQQWRSEMELAFKTWHRARQGLFHHKYRAYPSEDDLKKAVIDQCQVAGAINVLILKLIGYAGLMRASTLEGKYR